MIKIGLTGAQGSGKTTVLGFFRDQGFKTLCCDELAREITAPGQEAFWEIVSLFGPEILSETGVLNRRLIWEKIIADSNLRKALEAIIHPRLKVLIENFFQQASPGEIIVVEVPLLFEASWKDLFDYTVAVYTPASIIIKRIAKRYNISADEARKWLEIQLPPEEKARLADFVIDNSGSLEATKEQVRELSLFFKEQAKVVDP